MKLDFDLNKLPKEYRYNKENLLEYKYVDDNSLFVYQLLRHGRFTSGSPEMNFLYFKPFEWTTIDFIAFLISVSKEYGLEIQNIKTNMSPITEEYEVSMFEENGDPIPSRISEYQQMVANAMMRHDKMEPFIQPKWYEGAYKWILDKREKGDKSEEVELFNKFSSNKATLADLERALLYANRITPMFGKRDTELFMSKDIFGKIVDWTTFSIAISPDQNKKIDTDVVNYMKAFIEDKLERNPIGKRINDTTVVQSQNIFTFKNTTHYLGSIYRK